MLAGAYAAAVTPPDVYIFTTNKYFQVPHSCFYYFRDTSTRLTIENFKCGPDSFDFTQFKAAIETFGFTADVFWVRILAYNPFDYLIGGILEFQDPNVDRICFHQLNSDSVVSDTTGILYPFDRRPVYGGMFCFECSFPPRCTTSIYLRCSARKIFELPLVLRDRATFIKHHQHAIFFTGLAYGILIFFGIAALFLSFIYHDGNYRYFALFIISFCCMLAVRDGVSYRYFWPQSPWLQFHAQIVFFCVSIIFSILFVTNFLTLKKDCRPARSFGNVIIAGWIAGMLYGFAGNPRIAGFALDLMLMATVLYIFILTVLTRRHHAPSVQIMFLLWAIFITFVLFRTCVYTFNLRIPSTVKLFLHFGYYRHFGILLVTGVTTLAIGYKLHRLQNDQNKATLEAALLQRKTMELRLSNLQIRVQPHFLFNTINTIANMVVTDPRKAETALIEFSEFYRIILRHTGKNKTRISEEITIITRYLFLEKMRFGNRLDYSMDVDVQSEAVTIPPMSIQILVENSLKHGIHPKIEGGRVHVETRIQGGQCRIIVDDTGVGLATLQSTIGTGLTNLRSRLDLMYHGRYSLEIINKSAVNNTTGSGVIAILTLPVEGENLPGIIW